MNVLYSIPFMEPAFIHIIFNICGQVCPSPQSSPTHYQIQNFKGSFKISIFELQNWMEIKECTP